MTRRFTSKALTDDAQGKPCLLRVAGIQYHDPQTVVACHAPSEWKGTGMKSPDWASVRACHACHRVVDRVDPDPLTGELLSKLDSEFYWRRGLMRQWDDWFERGLLLVGKAQDW